MGLGALLFGKRKKFNGQVDIILREKLKINTSASTNLGFLVS